MNINTLTAALKTGIADSSAITAWCNANYNQDISIYINLDLTDPPQESDCPYVVVYPVGKQVGESLTPKRHSYEVVCCLYDENSTTTGNVVEFTGVANIEALRKLIETALVGASMATARIAELSIEYEFVENFPFMMAAMGVEILEDVLIGGNYLE